MPRVVFIILWSAVTWSAGAQHYFLKRDLRSEWLMAVDGNLVAYQRSADVRAVYVWLNPTRLRGDILVVESAQPFSTLLNGKFIHTEQTKTVLSVDSISRLAGKDELLLLGIYQEAGIHKSLTTLVMADIGQPESYGDSGPLSKPARVFSDFVVTVFSFLVIFFVALFRLNPKLTAGFLSVHSLFFLRESDEMQQAARITNRSNMLFYIFSSMVIAYVIILSTGEVSPVIKQGGFADGYWTFVFEWLETSIFILAILFLKAILVVVFSTVFGIRELSAFQFINFIRIILIATVIMAVLATGYFMVFNPGKGGQSFLNEVIFWVLISWVIVAFLKLNRRASFPVFHLFSYICVTELVPILLVAKILYE